MDFVKLQATGNDFILIDARTQEKDWSALARDMCQRHFGVGADGLLLALPSSKADLSLRMLNPDGSEAEACGNGLRCFVLYAREKGLVSSGEFTVETMAGIRTVRIRSEKGIQVSMGTPTFDPDTIPIILNEKGGYDTAKVVNQTIFIGDNKMEISAVSMGNPHAVHFIDQSVRDFPLAEVGPMVEHHHMFPNRVNFEVANIANASTVEARVWERGAGETLSCGSGACAIAVVAVSKGLVNSPIDVTLPGGILTVDWDGTGEVLLSGPAEIVFTGAWSE